MQGIDKRCSRTSAVQPIIFDSQICQKWNDLGGGTGNSVLFKTLFTFIASRKYRRESIH